MKVKTECAHGMFDKHKISRPVTDDFHLEILCDGGTTMNLVRDFDFDRQIDVWVEVHEPENS